MVTYYSDMSRNEIRLALEALDRRLQALGATPIVYYSSLSPREASILLQKLVDEAVILGATGSYTVPVVLEAYRAGLAFTAAESFVTAAELANSIPSGVILKADLSNANSNLAWVFW